jgi:hypothetical protein
VFEDVMEEETTFYDLFDDSPFEFDFETAYALCICVDHDKAPDLSGVARDRLVHQWFSRLVAPDLAGVHLGVFEYFASHRHGIRALHWRALEELVGAAFEANGFRVTLGPGRADEGIDLRLLEHAVYGDLLTTVQVKSGKTPVRLHYVQALAAASELEGADHGLFVTSSRFLPGVNKWAEQWTRQTGRRLSLATASEVGDWCQAAANRLWGPDAALRSSTLGGTGGLVGKVLSAPNDVRFIYHHYAFVLRQTPRALLLRRLRTRRVTGDVQRGTEVPDLPTTEATPGELFSARLSQEAPVSDRPAWWGDDGYLYTLWDGKPSYFDNLD